LNPLTPLDWPLRHENPLLTQDDDGSMGIYVFKWLRHSRLTLSLEIKAALKALKALQQKVEMLEKEKTVSSDRMKRMEEELTTARQILFHKQITQSSQNPTKPVISSTHLDKSRELFLFIM
jgi:small-conductance mechanosensitive channel